MKNQKMHFGISWKKLLLLVVGVLILSTHPALGQCGLIMEFNAPNLQPRDGFGFDVAMDGDVALVSSPDTAVYVYRSDGINWHLEAELLPSDGAPGRLWAESMAISGDVIVVGARDSDNGVLGAAYVFRYVNDTWGEVAILMASDSLSGDWFGSGVIIDDDLIGVYSAFNLNEGGTGAQYIFRIQEACWSEELKLTGLEGENIFLFGSSLVINMGRIAIPCESGHGVSILQMVEGIWTETERILLEDENESVHSMALNGDDLIITSRVINNGVSVDGFHTYQWNGSQWNFNATRVFPRDVVSSSISLSDGVFVVGLSSGFKTSCNPGAIQYYRREGDSWIPARQFILPDRQLGDTLGFRIATNGEVVFAGSRRTSIEDDSPGAAFMFLLEPLQKDCNGNLIEDDCEIISGAVEDCNGNGIPDDCDIALGIEVDENLDGVPDSCPVYPVPAPCLVEQLHADADGLTSPFSGPSVSIHGQVAVIGGTGKVAVFRRSGMRWEQEAILVGDQVEGRESFGTSVATNGNVIVVGAPRDWEGAELVGAIYIFRYSSQEGVWTREVKIRGEVTTQIDYFGSPVAMSGETIVIGVLPNLGLGHGAVYVYRLNDKVWSREDSITSPTNQLGDWFGSSIDIDDDTLVVGAWNDDGDPYYHGGSGAAYVFEHQDAAWSMSNKFVPDTSIEYSLGKKVAVDGNRIVFGSETTRQFCGLGRVGVVTVLENDGVSWQKKERFTLPFGNKVDSVDLSGDLAIVGSSWEQNNASAGGAVFVYRLDHDAEKKPSRILNPQPELHESFGWNVALDCGNAIVSIKNREVAAALGILYTGFSLDDCNNNGESDLCEINAGIAKDRNHNGVPDECEHPGDVNGHGPNNIAALLALLSHWGICHAPCTADLNDDGEVNVEDLLILLSEWGRP